MVPGTAYTRLPLASLLLLVAPLLAHAGQHSVFSDFDLLSQAGSREGFEQQLLNNADVFQGFASRNLLDSHGTYPPTYPSPSPAPPETPCEICTACVTKIREGFTTVNDFDNKTDAVNKWDNYCGGLEDYTDVDCEEAAKKISSYENVAKRPAALCRLVGDCGFEDANGCEIEDGTIGFCTSTGVDTGANVGVTNYTEGLDDTTPTFGDCLTSSDCNATSFCDTSEDYGSILACDTETGEDTPKSKGMCLDKCELPAIQAEKERVALLFSSEDVCDNNDNGNNCATGFQCGAALTACRTDLECKVNTTTNEPELTSNSCAGMCFRVSLELDSAKFSDDADAIMVGLNELASTFNVPCQSIFNSTTSEMLGSGATCSVTEEDRKTLIVSLTGDATVDDGDVLTLDNGQGLLEGYTDPDTKFTGSATVATCGSSCTPPRARLFGPATIRQPCNTADGYETNFIDSSNSFSASGRGLKKRTWGHSTADNACTTPPQELLDEITRANDESLEVLELNNSTLSAIEDDTGDVTYCITLEVESFLGASSSPVEHRFTIQTATSATPSVNVLLPTSTLISSGLTLSASVDTSSLCDGNEVAQYKWDCVDPCPLLSGSQFSRSIVRDISFTDLNSNGVGAGAKYTFQLTARLVKTNSDGSTSAREADPVGQEVEFEGDPLVASFTQDSASGDYLRPGTDTADTDIVLDASASYDPSEESVAMRYTFSCERPDGISNCFDTSDGSSVYTGVVNDAMWSLDLNKFVSDGDGNADVFILKVEVAKGSAPDVRRATATRTIRLLPATDPVPVRARVSQFCGGACPAASLSSEPLSFSVAILNEGDAVADNVGDASYSWTVNGEGVTAEDLVGESPSPNAESITFKGDAPILPRSGDIEVSCTVTVNGATGSAQTAVTLEGAPICANPNGCLIVTGAGNPPTQTFPDITFRMQARGFTGSNALTYEFGFVRDSETQVARIAESSPSADLDVQGGPGSYEVYVVAIDSRNGGRSARATGTIILETAGTAEQIEDAAEEGAGELDFEVLVNTGSNAAVQDGMKKANAFKNAKRNAGNGSNGGRRLLADPPATEAKTTDGLRETLKTLESNRVSDVLGALSAIFETTPSDVTQAEYLAKIVRDAMAILDSKGARGVGTNEVQLSLGRLGVATDLLSEQCTGDCLKNSNGDNLPDHWEIAMMVESTLASAWEVLRRTAASGVTTQAVSPAIAQAVSRNTIQATSTAVVAFDVENGNNQKARARFANEDSVKAFVDYCGNSNSPCYQKDRLALYLSYVTNPAIYTNVTQGFPGIIDSHYDAASMQPAAISGVVEVQFDFKPADGDSVCTSDECPMVLEIPINTDFQSMLDGKMAACVRVTGNAANNEFNTEVVEADKDVDSSSTSVQCTVSRLGQYILMSYTPAPTPPPPPGEGGEEPSPSPSPPDQDIDEPTTTIPPPPPFLNPIPEDQIEEECTGNSNKAITMTVVFNLDREEFNETNIQDLSDKLKMSIGGLLGLEGGLNCDVTLDFVSSSGGRRLLDSTWNVAADLGESTPARIVRKSRRVVDKAIEEDGGSFQEKLIGDFVVQGKTLTVNEEQTSVTSDPDEFEGCSTGSENLDRQITATITMDLGDLLDGKPDEEIATLELEAASQMEEDLMNVTNYEEVVGDCPVLFSFSNTTATGRRSLLDSDNKLTITTSDGVSGNVVQAFHDSAKNVDFDDIELDGNSFAVSVEFDELSAELSSAFAVVVAASTMALAVLAMVIASGNFL